MTADLLADVSDVAALVGRTLTTSEAAKVTAMLRKASADFRREARQQITPGTSSHRCIVRDGRVYPKQAPITDVAAVVDGDGNTVPFTFSDGILAVDRPHGFEVKVTYAHGFAEVPDDVRWAVAEAVKRAFTVHPKAAEGYSQHSESRGPFTESGAFAAWAIGGQTLLAPSELETARSYRPVRPRMIVQRLR